MASGGRSCTAILTRGSVRGSVTIRHEQPDGIGAGFGEGDRCDRPLGVIECAVAVQVPGLAHDRPVGVGRDRCKRDAVAAHGGVRRVGEGSGWRPVQNRDRSRHDEAFSPWIGAEQPHRVAAGGRKGPPGDRTGAVVVASVPVEIPALGARVGHRGGEGHLLVRERSRWRYADELRSRDLGRESRQRERQRSDQPRPQRDRNTLLEHPESRSRRHRSPASTSFTDHWTDVPGGFFRLI